MIYLGRSSKTCKQKSMVDVPSLCSSVSYTIDSGYLVHAPYEPHLEVTMHQTGSVRLIKSGIALVMPSKLNPVCSGGSRKLERGVQDSD